ncbi:glucose transporter [Bradyrhizobium sp. STM 3562]
MGTTLHTFGERVQLALAAGLLVACTANVALVWAFL